MRNPYLDAFKSLDEVDDAVVAKEKRIIKESLEESDYKVDEDIVEVDETPIENTFTASNLYEGLDDETLDTPEESKEIMTIDISGDDMFEKGKAYYYSRTGDHVDINGTKFEIGEDDSHRIGYSDEILLKNLETGEESFISKEDFIRDAQLLSESILNEKLPKDLGKAYRRLDRENQNRAGFSGNDRRQSMVDYEKAEYKEITPEEAIKAKKEGRIKDLRILKDGQLICFRDDGYPLMGLDWVEKEDAYTNRNGKVIRDTRLMPASHVFNIADKIYLTTESENRFPYGKWVDGNYVYDNPVQLHRVQQQKDYIPDTGKHKRVERDYKGNRRYTYGDPEYDEQKALEYKKEAEKFRTQLSELEDKWEEGDISRKDYESQKANIEKAIDRYAGYAQEASRDAIRRRGSLANDAAEKRFALSRDQLSKNINRYKDLKGLIRSAEYDLDNLKQRGGLSSWSLKGGSYESKIKEIEELKQRMASIQKQIEKLQAEATDELKQANIDQNTKALDDAQKKVDDLKSEMDSLLKRAHKSSGKEESLNEALVDLRDDEAVEEAKEEKEKDRLETPVEQIVDPNATIIDELEKSYVGKAILECTKCFGHHYIAPEDLEMSEEKDSDGNKIYNLEAECPVCHAKEGFLLVGQVAEIPEEGKEEEKPESEEEDNSPAIIEPEEKEEKVETEEKEEFSEQENELGDLFGESLIDFDEVSFDKHVTKYLTEVYSNVESYKSEKGSLTDEGIMIEGLIKFKSGKEKPTTFKLSLEDNGIKGLNEGFDQNDKIYSIEGKIKDNMFITENIIYKYNIGDELVEGCTKSDKEIADTLVANGSCETKKEAEDRVAHMSDEDKEGLCKSFEAQAKDNLLNN